MRSLLVRIFLSFWLMIVITIAAAAAVGFFYAERARSAIESFEVSDAMLEASAALQVDGREGLTDWLKSLPRVTESLIYVVDDKGNDLLDRRVPVAIEIALQRFGDRRRSSRRDIGNLRPARPFTELVGPDGSVYTFFVLHPKSNFSRWFASRGTTALALLAVLVSAGISYLLAGAMSRPIRQLRNSAAALAEGRLDTRVAGNVSRRGDEIGLLAREFDRMASELQGAAQRQTELTRNVSHELRSPLARLRVALELARRKAGDLPEFARMDRETEHLDGLIGQILEFSRLDADGHERPAAVYVADLLQSIVDDVQFEYGDGVKIELHGAEENLTISADENALRSGISNVLRNAAQHGRAGGTVDVSVSRNAERVAIVVQDGGGGVDDKDLQHLFEPFYRATTDDASAHHGSGLGLAIAARAAARNGGRIMAENYDGGLRVTLDFPAASDDAVVS